MLEMMDGSSPIFKITVLDLNHAVIDRAEGFMMHASKHKFGSQDALIAATSIIYSTNDRPMMVVTSDKALKAAMAEEGIDFVVPGACECRKIQEKQYI